MKFHIQKPGDTVSGFVSWFWNQLLPVICATYLGGHILLLSPFMLVLIALGIFVPLLFSVNVTITDKKGVVV